VVPPAFPDASTYDPRFTSEVVYEHLRELIVTGFLEPRVELKQTVLASELGISRTPLREAFRRLQAEGLITVEVNKRATVSELSVPEIDELYGARIVLECLGLRLSTGRLSDVEIDAAEHALDEMWRASIEVDLRGWTSAHLEFHMALVAQAGDHPRQTIRRLASECDRYLFCYHRSRPLAPMTRHREHQALLQAVLGDDPALSGRLIAHHIAATALDLIHDLDPDRVVTGVQFALEIVSPGHDRSELEELTLRQVAPPY